MDEFPAGRARVVTWNLWWRFGPCWRDRQHDVLETLRGVDADVVALQEVWDRGDHQAHQFTDQLGCTPASRRRRTRRDLTRRGPEPRWGGARPGAAEPLAGHEPADGGAAGSAPHAGLGRPGRHPGPPCRPAARGGSVPGLRARLQRRPDRTGAGAGRPRHRPRTGRSAAGGRGRRPQRRPDSPVLRPLRNVLVDAWAAGGGDPAAGTAPVDAGERLLDQRIDHIVRRSGRLRQRVVVESARLAGAPVAGLDPSDHRGRRRPALDRD
jgi:hypothetical protein